MQPGFLSAQSRLAKFSIALLSLFLINNTINHFIKDQLNSAFIVFLFIMIAISLDFYVKKRILYFIKMPITLFWSGYLICGISFKYDFYQEELIFLIGALTTIGGAILIGYNAYFLKSDT